MDDGCEKYSKLAGNHHPTVFNESRKQLVIAAYRRRVRGTISPQSGAAPLGGGVHPNIDHQASRVTPLRRSPSLGAPVRPATGALISTHALRAVMTEPPMADRGTRKLEAKNSGTFQECLDNAINWDRRAASATDPAAKAVFARLACCWMEIARSWRDLQKIPPSN
jgi:hypothetical protein